MFKAVIILFLYTETPLHVGSGNSLGTVDLPIQRERHTDLPMIQSSGIKGKLRNSFSFKSNGYSANVIDAIFGAGNTNTDSHAGALSPGDGRILLFPVRSLGGIFAWITCPFVINRFIRDLNLTKPSSAINWSIPAIDDDKALIPTKTSKVLIDESVVLEEFSFTANEDQEIKKLAHFLAAHALPEMSEYDYWREKLKTDLVVISDNAFKDFCRFSTDVVSRTKLNSGTKIVEKGALWTEENLPGDTLLYTPVFASAPRCEQKNISDEVKDAATILETFANHLIDVNYRLQLGGNETVGRGIVVTRVFEKE